MTTVFPWASLRRFSRHPRPASPWQNLLSAALRTEFYSRPEPRARLDWLRQNLAGGPPQPGALPLEAVRLSFFFRNAALFRNPMRSPAPRRRLELPWKPRPRVTAVAPWFPVERGVAVLARPDRAAIEASRPEALVAPVALLRRMAAAVLEGRLRLPRLQYGVIALLGTGFALLEEEDRELLWQAFHVPLLVQWRGFRGELLACGCEAQPGLHVRTDAALLETAGGCPADCAYPEGGMPARPGSVRGELLLTSLDNTSHPVLRLRTGIHANWETGRCGCGAVEARLVDLRAATSLTPSNRARSAGA